MADDKPLAVDRLSALGMLAGGILHEIANPLTALDVTLRRMDDDVAAGDLQACAKQLQAARTMIDVVIDMVRDMRTLMHGGTELSVVDVNDVVRSAVRIAEPSVRRRATIQVQVERNLTIAAVPGLLAQIIVNLVMNAAHAMAPGRTGTISVVAEARGEHICIDVSDDGQGIAPEIMDKIFEPFFTTKPEGEGTGLGLALCRAIAQQHKGEIRVRSELGKGTTMTVVLPRATGEAVSADIREALQTRALFEARRFFRQHVTRLNGPIETAEIPPADITRMLRVLEILAESPQSSGEFYDLITLEPGWNKDSFTDEEAQAFVKMVRELLRPTAATSSLPPSG